MRKFAVICCTLALACGARASWYWPFGSDEDEAEPPRISELMEPATDLIEEASDLAMDGKSDEAIEKYRKALAELDRVERENPERAQTSEFATLRNKRAYVTAARDSLLLGQAKENGRVVAVSDTTELEKKLAEERWTDHMKLAKEAFARRDGKTAMGEMRKALGCYTNVFLRAAVCNVKATVDLLSGDFGGTCRSLTRAETCLRGYETADSFVRERIAESVSGIWAPLHDYGEVVATAEVVRVRGNIDVNCIPNLAFLEARLQQYDFKQAKALHGAVTNLMTRISDAARNVRAEDEGLAAGVDVFNAAANDFGKLGPEMAKIRDVLVRVEIPVLKDKVSELLDGAEKLREGGKSDEAIEKYRKALDELDRFERENPERAQTSEFATLRSKRAYVNATIDSMLLNQVKENGRVVAVSDTTELEKKQAEERNKDKSSAARPSGVGDAAKSSNLEPAKPVTRREQAIFDIANGDYAAAELFIKGILESKPNSAMALNLKAAMEMKQGKLDEAEKTLDHAVSTNPRDPSAYYNMAVLSLQKDEGNKSSAKRYYETYRAMGGAADSQLEALLK